MIIFIQSMSMSANNAELQRIGRLLAETRKQRGVSQRELAVRVGIDHTSISAIENGRYNVSVGILSKMLTSLKCRLSIEQTGGEDR